MGGLYLSIVLIAALVIINFFPKGNRLDIRSFDSEKRDKRNPLYKKKERYRKIKDSKRGRIFTAELKLDYYCQVSAVIIIILCMVYGAYSWFAGDDKSFKIGIVLFILAFLHIFITLAMESYYITIFKSAYQSAPWKKWQPFEYTGNSIWYPDRIRDSLFKEFKEINAHILMSCKKLGYQMKQEKEWSEKKKIWFWVKEEKNCIKIFETIRLSFLEWEDIDWLNETFDELLEQVLKGKKKSIRICFTFFICVDEGSKAFHYIMHRRVIQGIRRFRLPAGMIMEEGEIQIAESAEGYGKRIYKKMCQEFFNILGIKDPRY